MSTATFEFESTAIKITTDPTCWQGGDHQELVRSARVDRIRRGFNVDQSAVVCMRCAKAIPLKL